MASVRALNFTVVNGFLQKYDYKIITIYATKRQCKLMEVQTPSRDTFFVFIPDDKYSMTVAESENITLVNISKSQYTSAKQNKYLHRVREGLSNCGVVMISSENVYLQLSEVLNIEYRLGDTLQEDNFQEPDVIDALRNDLDHIRQEQLAAKTKRKVDDSDDDDDVILIPRATYQDMKDQKIDMGAIFIVVTIDFMHSCFKGGVDSLAESVANHRETLTTNENAYRMSVLERIKKQMADLMEDLETRIEDLIRKETEVSRQLTALSKLRAETKNVVNTIPENSEEAEKRITETYEKISKAMVDCLIRKLKLNNDANNILFSFEEVLSILEGTVKA